MWFITACALQACPTEGVRPHMTGLTESDMQAVAPRHCFTSASPKRTALWHYSGRVNAQNNALHNKHSQQIWSFSGCIAPVG